MQLVLAWAAAVGFLLAATGLAANRLASATPVTDETADAPHEKDHAGLHWPAGTVRARTTLRPFRDPQLEVLRRRMLFWFGALLGVGVGGTPLVILIMRSTTMNAVPSIAAIAVVGTLALAAAVWAVRGVGIASERGTSLAAFLMHIGMVMGIAFGGILAGLWL